MTNVYYQEQVLENIARKVLCGYDSALYYGSPAAVPIEEMIEVHGVSLEYQYLRKNGRILGKTIFDEGLEAVYDMENREYTLFPVRAGTILIDASLCEEDASTGRLRFTCAHELAHWILHKKLYTGTGRSAAMITEQSETTLEVQANMLGSAILMPIAQIKRCFYQLRGGRQDGQLIDDMANVFQVSRQAMRIRLTNHRLLLSFIVMFTKKGTAGGGNEGEGIPHDLLPGLSPGPYSGRGKPDRSRAPAALRATAVRQGGVVHQMSKMRGTDRHDISERSKY